MHLRRFLPILAHPASGSDPDRHQVDYAVCLTSCGDWRENRLPQLDRELVAAGLPVTVEGSDTLVQAVKPAESGQGLIVRIAYFGAEPGRARITSRNGTIRSAFLCDGMERNLQELRVNDGAVQVELQFSLVSVRIDTLSGVSPTASKHPE